MALPMMIGMFVQTLYFLVDLYFVGQLGATELAGLSLAGNVMFFIFALTQILNVGTATLVSHAVGAKNQASANGTFNQSMMLSAIAGVVVCLVGYLGAETYLSLVSSDAGTIAMGKDYLHWFIPCMALQFVMVAMSAALRGTGIVKPTMLVQTISILINIVLSPILISGYFTGYAMGIAGAGLASSISVVCAVFMLFYYFKSAPKYININFSLWSPDKATIKRLLGIGFPAGGEFLIMFIYMGTIYWLIQGFGAQAQAGFGLGTRIMQSLFLPAMAIAFAAPAIAGQNFGANNFARVKETFKWASIMTCSLMAILTLVCYYEAELLLKSFSNDKQVILVSATFLHIICWNFIPAGLVNTCSGMFQSLGNAWPALISITMRLITFIIPALWLSKQSDFTMEQLWLVSVISVFIQTAISLWLLRKEFTKRLEKKALANATQNITPVNT